MMIIRIRNALAFILLIFFLSNTAGCISLQSTPPDKEKMEEYFTQDKDDLIIIADYLISLDYPSVWINKSRVKNGIMFTGAATREKKIEDKTVLESLKRILNDKNYIRLGKDEDTIFFEKWNYIEKVRGFAFPINNEDSPCVEYLAKSEPLSENGWYYYESDYEKVRNQRITQ